jgi:hypothetical protein
MIPIRFGGSLLDAPLQGELRQSSSLNSAHPLGEARRWPEGWRRFPVTIWYAPWSELLKEYRGRCLSAADLPDAKALSM